MNKRHHKHCLSVTGITRITHWHRQSYEPEVYFFTFCALHLWQDEHYYFHGLCSHKFDWAGNLKMSTQGWTWCNAKHKTPKALNFANTWLHWVCASPFTFTSSNVYSAEQQGRTEERKNTSAVWNNAFASSSFGINYRLATTLRPSFFPRIRVLHGWQVPLLPLTCCRIHLSRDTSVSHSLVQLSLCCCQSDNTVGSYSREGCPLKTKSEHTSNPSPEMHSRGHCTSYLLELIL